MGLVTERKFNLTVTRKSKIPLTLNYLRCTKLVRRSGKLYVPYRGANKPDPGEAAVEK